MLDHVALLFNWNIVFKCGETAPQLRPNSAPAEYWSVEDNSFVNCLQFTTYTCLWLQLPCPLLVPWELVLLCAHSTPTHVHIINNKSLKKLNRLSTIPESYSNWHFHKPCAGGLFLYLSQVCLYLLYSILPNGVLQWLSFACLTVILNTGRHVGKCAFLHFSPCNWVLGFDIFWIVAPYAVFCQVDTNLGKENCNREKCLHKISLQVSLWGIFWIKEWWEKA